MRMRSAALRGVFGDRRFGLVEADFTEHLQLRAHIAFKVGVTKTGEDVGACGNQVEVGPILVGDFHGRTHERSVAREDEFGQQIPAELEAGFGKRDRLDPRARNRRFT